MRKIIVGLFAGALLLSLAADAGTLYTVRPSDDMVRKIDTQTLQITDVGTLNVPYDFGGLAYDGQKMYMVQGFAGTDLYTVSLTTGAATRVGTHSYKDMFGLAWDPSTNKLYGGRSTTGRGFFSIDRTTGAATPIGGDPGINMDGLLYDSKRNQVVAGNAGPGDLYTVDRSTGVPTLIYAGDFFNNCGMAYDPEIDKYWMIDYSGNLYQFDPANGYARTLVMGGLGAHDGLEFIPEPGTLVLALVGLMALRRR